MLNNNLNIENIKDVKSFKLTKRDIISIIDHENGIGYSNNINVNGYTFTKNESFIIFEFKLIEDVKICHIKYIYIKNKKDLITIMVNCCNFWMGNRVQFIFFKEKQKTKSAIKFLEELNFRVEIIDRPKWKFSFDCKNHENKNEECKCVVLNLCK